MRISNRKAYDDKVLFMREIIHGINMEKRFIPQTIPDVTVEGWIWVIDRNDLNFTILNAIKGMWESIKKKE
jgi:hypothetical protein